MPKAGRLRPLVSCGAPFQQAACFVMLVAFSLGRKAMKPIVAVVAPGMMGSGVGQRLVENGVEVRTSLAGRSAATVARAKAAGMIGVSDAEIAASDIILSILPPGDALGLAERL